MKITSFFSFFTIAAICSITNTYTLLEYFPTRNKIGPLSERFLKFFGPSSGIQYFVESGTFGGDTTAAASPFFKHVHTIELHHEIAKRARKRFANTPNVTVHEGASPLVLKAILPRISGPALFWLDAHYCGGGTAQCLIPIRAEIDAIGSFDYLADSVVVIDDIRLFQPELCQKLHGELEQYPAVQTIIEDFKKFSSHHELALIEDALVFYPRKLSIIRSPTVIAVTLFRTTTLSETMMLAIEEMIMQMTPAERTTLKYYCDHVAHDGFCGYYLFWLGLSYLPTDVARARTLFEIARAQGIKRAEYYLTAL